MPLLHKYFFIIYYKHKRCIIAKFSIIIGNPFVFFCLFMNKKQDNTFLFASSGKPNRDICLKQGGFFLKDPRTKTTQTSIGTW